MNFSSVRIERNGDVSLHTITVENRIADTERVEISDGTPRLAPPRLVAQETFVQAIKKRCDGGDYTCLKQKVCRVLLECRQ